MGSSVSLKDYCNQIVKFVQENNVGRSAEEIKQIYEKQRSKYMRSIEGMINSFYFL